jgi:hypothetical protein
VGYQVWSGSGDHTIKIWSSEELAPPKYGKKFSFPKKQLSNLFL